MARVITADRLEVGTFVVDNPPSPWARVVQVADLGDTIYVVWRFANGRCEGDEYERSDEFTEHDTYLNQRCLVCGAGGACDRCWNCGIRHKNEIPASQRI